VAIEAGNDILFDNIVSIYALSRARGAKPVIQSITPDKLKAGQSHTLDIRGANFGPGVGFHFGPDIKVSGKPRIRNATTAVVAVQVSDTAKPGKRLIAGSRKAVTITKDISKRGGATLVKTAGGRDSFMMDAYKTRLLAGMSRYYNTFIGHGEVPVLYSQRAGIPEQYMQTPPVLWPFKWSTDVKGMVSARWQLSALDPSSGKPTSLITAGYIQPPNIPQPGRDAYFYVDFTPILQPIYDKDKAKAKAAPTQTKFSRKLPDSVANKITGTTASKTRSPALMSLLDKQELYAALLQKKPQNVYFVKITPLDFYKRPIEGSSNTVQISYQRPETTEMMPPPPLPSGPQPVYPTVNVLKYEPPKKFSCDEVAFHYMVLPSCPPMVMSSFGWKPYDRVYLPPRNDKDFWDYVEEGVSAVFGFLGDLTNAISGAWNSIKSTCVDGVCGGSPECKSFVGPALDAGLVSLGIPPEIPDFSDLGDLSVDYAAKRIAAEIAAQSGVPVPESQIRGRLEGARISLKQGGGSGAPFLVPDPNVQPRPPVLTFEVVNRNEKEISTPFVLTLKFAQKGDDVFKPAEIPIPPLQPKERIKMPLLLDLQPSVRYDALQLYWTEMVSVCAFTYAAGDSKGAFCYWGGSNNIFSAGSWMKTWEGKPLL